MPTKERKRKAEEKKQIETKIPLHIRERIRDRITGNVPPSKIKLALGMMLRKGVSYDDEGNIVAVPHGGGDNEGNRALADAKWARIEELKSRFPEQWGKRSGAKVIAAKTRFKVGTVQSYIRQDKLRHGSSGQRTGSKDK